MSAPRAVGNTALRREVKRLHDPRIGDFGLVVQAAHVVCQEREGSTHPVLSEQALRYVLAISGMALL
jgi:hypothetical protein